MITELEGALKATESNPLLEVIKYSLEHLQTMLSKSLLEDLH